MQTEQMNETGRSRPRRGQSAVMPHREERGARGRVSDGLERRAKGLGWFSIGLGLAEIMAPRALSDVIGLDDVEGNRRGLAALGMREIAAGIAILANDRPVTGMWSRVAGDVMDLAVLGRAFRSPRNDRRRLGFAAAAVVGCIALDAMTAQQLMRADGSRRQPMMRMRGRPLPLRHVMTGTMHVRQTITVNRPPQEVYEFWRSFENFPRFMAHLDSVQVRGNRSLWRAKAPAGMRVEWEAEIIEDVPGRVIAWRSLEGADIPNFGSVRFDPAPGNRGTEVHVELRYEAPVARVGKLIAKMFGEEPGQQIKGDLRRFKQVMEVGEVVHSDSSIHHGMHPARPPMRSEMSELDIIGRSAQ